MSRALISKRLTQSIFYVAHSNRLNESFTVFFMKIASVFGSKVMIKRSSDKKILKNFFRVFHRFHHIFARKQRSRHMEIATEFPASSGANGGFRGGARS